MKLFILSFIAVIAIAVLLYLICDYILIKILYHIVDCDDEVNKLDD